MVWDLYEKYKDNPKVKYLLLEKPFPEKTNEWENQAIQREFILENLDFAGDDDLIFFFERIKLNLDTKLKGIFNEHNFCQKCQMNTCYCCCEPHKQFVQNFGNAPLQINTIRNQIAQKKKRKVYNWTISNPLKYFLNHEFMGHIN